LILGVAVCLAKTGETAKFDKSSRRLTIVMLLEMNDGDVETMVAHTWGILAW